MSSRVRNDEFRDSEAWDADRAPAPAAVDVGQRPGDVVSNPFREAQAGSIKP